MITEAVILAGGFGTRLREVVNDVPKPLATVANRPFLDYLFDYLEHFSVKHAVLSVGYQGEKIQDHYGESYGNMRLSYAFEKEPLGTGGGIQLAFQQCSSEDVLVLNGDTFFDVDLNKLSQEQDGRDVTMVLRSIPKPDRYGTVETNDQMRITQFQEKKAGLDEGMINGGVYFMKRDVFERMKVPFKFSIEQDFFAAFKDQLKIYGMISDGYFIDIGIPEDFYLANHAFRSFKY